MLMGRSAASKLRRKSQREAVELQEQSDATLAMEEEELAMEEEEEVVFKRQRIVPDTPRASRDSTPGPDDREEERRDFTTVLQMVKTVEIRSQPWSWTIRTFGLPVMICAGSAIVRGWRLVTCHDW